MRAEPVLSVRNLDVHYGDFQAVWDVSLDVEPGRIVSIIGANGAAKSTLLKTIAGAMTPTRGEILYKGGNINRLKAFQTLSLGISYVPEGRRIFPRLTVLENLLIGSYTPTARANREAALDKVYELFPWLKDRRSQMGVNLSGGEQQMLAIARSLMSGPEVILFDEISLGLAPRIIKQIYEKVRAINREGVTVVLVEQDVQRSLKTADWAYILQEGRMVLEGDPKDLTEERVRKAYFGIEV